MKLRTSIVMLLLSLSASAFADNQANTPYKPGEFYVAPGIAYYHFSDKRDLQNTAMANLSAGLAISDQFSLEAFYGQAATNETPSNLDKDTRFYIYSGEGVYHFNPDADAIIHPYMLGGLSITNQVDNNDSAGNTTLLGMSAGLGIEYFVNPNISLFTDARDIYTLSGGKNDWMLNAGIKFLFGGNQKDNEKTPQQPIETGGASGFYQLQDRSNV
ncbi:MAG: outer membrane beta-barrel protein [Pseudomonadota bacterium]